MHVTADHSDEIMAIINTEELTNPRLGSISTIVHMCKNDSLIGRITAMRRRALEERGAHDGLERLPRPVDEMNIGREERIWEPGKRL
jgi:hypothetical protein